MAGWPEEWGGGVRFPAGGEGFSIQQSIHTDCAAHSVSYAVGAGALFPGVRVQGREADCSPASSAEANKWSSSPTPHSASWRLV
jgi:hypothetical protein